ncbi:MAG: hypothetical protein HYX38_35465 [Rhodospirillales bacterium]|nr:hypothetical protein [Rhodospirillales bacterium]
MAMHYFIDSRRRLVSVTAEGGITRADVDAYLEAVIGAGALEYRKLFDWRAGTPAMDFPEVMSVVAEARSHHDRPHGALAIVLSEQQRQSDELARVLGVLLSARRPMRVFSSVRTARRWLEGNAASVS